MKFDFAHLSIASLMLLTFAYAPSRKVIKNKPIEAWTIDFLSLLNHFFIIPLAQGLIVYGLLGVILPNLKSTIEIGWIAALICTMGIDYGWYWNHRAFHAQTKFWNLHAVHHDPKQLDIFASSRNTLISPLFMVYMWLAPLIIFLAIDPVPFLIFSGLGLIINFWGHTEFNLPRDSAVRKIFALALIQPEDHFWHHSAENTYCNFGTIFNFWDKIHGTWHQPGRMPQSLGFEHNISLWRKLLFPW